MSNVEDDDDEIKAAKKRKVLVESDDEDENEKKSANEIDISLLEAPTFTTLEQKRPNETLLKLDWDHDVDLIGKKVLNPMIHCCEKCAKPILVYGRLIPCKHVFCFACACADQSAPCPKCAEKILRVERAALGSIFMCGRRVDNSSSKGGCGRTYLSQRDLHAHIQHRHVKKQQQSSNSNLTTVPIQESSSASSTSSSSHHYDRYYASSSSSSWQQRSNNSSYYRR